MFTLSSIDKSYKSQIRTRSAAGTAQRDRIPNLNPIGGRISTTQSNKTKIENHDIISPSRTVLDRRPEQQNAIGYPT